MAMPPQTITTNPSNGTASTTQGEPVNIIVYSYTPTTYSYTPTTMEVTGTGSVHTKPIKVKRSDPPLRPGEKWYRRFDRRTVKNKQAVKGRR